MRKLCDIAKDIQREWGVKLSPYARPYLYAMEPLDTIRDCYGADDGRSIVLYFLSNASGFRGERARALKAELKEHLQ